ncbi:unnamed protein product [Rotaria sp. Silwood1]|nr:unnamed protein product [Rotaria sp. Silwood1]CAF1135773.1 unnamed protein product [Rotaria sp. Silwood1]
MFSKSQHEDIFDIKAAQVQYEQCFVPLLYHELWEEIKRDTKEYDLLRNAGDIEIQINEHKYKTTRLIDQSEPVIPTALIFATSLNVGTGKSKTIAGIVIRLLPKLSEGKKILLCAPSNNACDELLKRILNELDSKYETG